MGISNWGLLWTIVMPMALILYYFYRKKYKEQPVSSIIHWQQLMKEKQVSPYLKKLQQNALFYLQLAALLLLVFTLLGPFTEAESLEGGEFIFVIDTSASMLAGTPTLLEQQKDRMKDLASRTGDKPVTIIQTGSTPEILASRETAERELHRTIDEITPNFEAPQMEKTLLFAETLPDDDSAVIHIFTDSLERHLLENKTGAAYVVHANTEPLANVSIRQFGIAQGEQGQRAIVQLVNDSEKSSAGTLEITGGEYAESVEIEMAPGEEKLMPFESLPNQDLWQADLTVDDDYEVDNRAFAYSRRSADTVILDNALHGLAARGLESLGIRVNAAPAEQLEKFAGIPLITNQSNLIGGNAPVLLFGRNDASSFEAEGEVLPTDHPLFAYAPMENVFISALYPAFEGYQTIASVGEDPFIQLSPEGDIIVLADIQATDWPLSPSFPLFLWSAVNFLADNEDYLGTFWPNEQRAVTLTGAAGEWEIFKGEEYQFSYIEGQNNFRAPKEPGVYSAVSDGETKNFIVQLGNEEKSVAAGQNFSAGTANAEKTSAEQSMIPWLLLIVLLLVLAEWEVYRRGTSLR